MSADVELPPDDACPWLLGADAGEAVSDLGDHGLELPSDDHGLELPSDDLGLELPSDDLGLDLLWQDPEGGVIAKRRKRKRNWQREVGPTRKQLMHGIHHISLRDPELWHISVPEQLSGVPQEDGMEAYSPPRVMPVMAELGLRANVSADILTGWDFDSPLMRHLFVVEIKGRRPWLLILSPPCTMLCMLMGWNWWRMKRDHREARLSQGLLHVEFSMFLADLQEYQGCFYVFEHPRGAITWEHSNGQRIMSRKTCLVADFDMCAFGTTRPIIM